MSKIIDYLSQYFGTKDLSQYPVLSKVNEHPENLDYIITMASSSIFHDTATKPRSLDLRLI